MKIGAPRRSAADFSVMNRQVVLAVRRWLVRHIYADHNDSDPVRRALSGCLSNIHATERALNVGAGTKRLAPFVTNTDIEPNEAIDVCCSAEALPFANGTFALVLSQETLEHLADPNAALGEIWRVLKPGGVLYCQVPFIIGWHPCPSDYWRFSREGIQRIISEHGFTCEEIGIAVGPAVALYRILVEFVAITWGGIWHHLYLPAKGCAAAVLYPLKLLDVLYRRNLRGDRLAAGYYVVARKLGEPSQKRVSFC